MNAIRDGYISTVSGRRFYFDDIQQDSIQIEDIAHALSNLCRFTGQCFHFYSVAEHSVLVSYTVPRELALVGLLHDATEAYCADLARPLKRLLPDYQTVEARIWSAIAQRFDLPEILPVEIKRADMAMLKLEVTKLLPPHCAIELDLPGETADVGLRCWDPCRARYAFMERYRELTNRA